MTAVYETRGDTKTCDILVVADHASNDVPGDIDLGITRELLDDHIAWDIGTRPIARLLGSEAGWAAIIAGYSRLVVDLNRERENPAVIPAASDSIAIPGNKGLTMAIREDRLTRYFDPYHAAIEESLALHSPKLLLSLHSFTPRLRSGDQGQRPWHIGVLYNEDERAARLALPMLERFGVCVGDQQPYSGRRLNATMNRHGEGNGIAYLGIEIRQDEITEPEGQMLWTKRLLDLCNDVALNL